MNFKQLNESFKSFGITEDVDEFNDLENDYDLPIKDVDIFEQVYLDYNYFEEDIENIIDNLAQNAVVVAEATPDVPYLSNGDPGYPGEGPEIELDMDPNDYNELANNLFDSWLQELLEDSEVATPKLIENIDNYKDQLKDLFNDDVMPSEDSLYTRALDKAYELYENNYFENY